MIWFVFGHIFSTIISLVRLSRLSENDKDIEILILRHQLDVMVRKQNHPVRPNRAEKTILAVLTVQMKQATKRTIGQLGEIIRIVRPETVIRWHKELVRRKWTYLSVQEQRWSPQDQTGNRKPDCTAGSRESALGLCQN